MKKSILFLLAASALLSACQKNEITSLDNAPVLHAVIEDDSLTKTSMDADNNIRWSENDQVIAFMKSSYGHKYQVKPSFVGKVYADFSKVSSGSGDDLSAGLEYDHNIVYYPYSETIECEKSGSGYSLSIALPTEQNYTSGSFGNGSMPMVAVSEDNDITFRNVCGGMKLRLKGTQKVVSIKLEGKNNEKLSGAATVTAYPGDLSPVITMSSGASTSVTLDCGDGVQLNESTTEFIISLPPVLFSKGFTVTVTDSDNKTYTVETDKANTVLRSSLLTMPAVVLKEEVVEEEENPGSEGTLVEAISLNKTSLTLAPGTSYALTAKVVPTDATDKTLTWSSDGAAVARVDQNGVVTAVSDGSAVITVVALGGVSESCTVTVITPPTSQATADYVDEYGINHGKGISIGATVWAPVNCGYKAASATDKGYPYGKLYQWGRKYGQGYNTSYDADGPTIEEGPVSLNYGQSSANANVFFTSTSSGFRYDWLSTQNDKLWNSGTESAPVKTEYDPCPKGWRVPTYAELNVLKNTKSSWTTNDGQKGYWFSGASDTKYEVAINEAAEVFFPAAGYRDYDGNAGNRGNYGYYWSSRPSNYDACYLYFLSSYTYMSYNRRAYGYSVRCVQE